MPREAERSSLAAARGGVEEGSARRSRTGRGRENGAVLRERGTRELSRRIGWQRGVWSESNKKIYSSFPWIPALWTLLLRNLLLFLLSCPAQHCKGREHFSDNPQGESRLFSLNREIPPESHADFVCVLLAGFFFRAKF